MRAGSKDSAAGKLRGMPGSRSALVTGASGAALALAFLQGSAALAATYTASDAIEFANALAAANADGDPSSTIVMTGSFTVGNVTASKTIRIDTQGFTLTGTNLIGNSWELFGNITGGTAALGLTINGGGLLTNHGTITGFPTRGGATVSNASTLVNNGTILGGSNGVTGASITLGGGTIINNNLIQGGAALAAAGVGVSTQIPSGTATIINNSTGVIRGATSGDGTVGAVGVRLGGIGGQTIRNFGVIEGGFGAAAITSAVNSATIVNAGTISAGSNSANAITVTAGAASVTTLELQAGSTITGNVVASAAGTRDTLRLAGDSNWTLEGGLGSASQYQNFDMLEKTGASTWTIAGSGDFSGTTTISEGTLIVNGSLAGSAVTVASGARLGGSGTVGAVTFASGSRITPGNSIGTLTINGAYVQNAGAVYEVEIDPGTATSDRIDVKGTATLASGAAIQVINYTGGTFVAGQRYTILTSTGLTGSYGDADIAVSPFLSLRNGTDATNAYLTVVRTATAGGIGGTGNEQAVGTAVDSLPAGNTVQTGVYNQPSIDAARGTLGQLAGEIHASARTVLIDESWLLRSAVNDRLRSAFGAVGSTPMATLSYGFTADLSPAVKGPLPKPPSAERFAVWGQGYGSFGRTRSDGNAASLSRSTGGLLVGADAAVFEALRLGVVAGYSRSSFDVNGRLSSGESDNYHLGLYGGGQWGALSLRTGLSYSWHDLSTRRSIVAAGLGDTLRADYDAGTAQAFGELGYRIDLGQTALGQVALEPFAGLAYVVLRSDRFSERGGAAALSGASDDTGIGYTTLGLRAATTTRLSGLDLTLRGGLGWRHAFGDVDPKTMLAFAGSNPFSIAGLPIARDAALVEAGLDLALGANTTLGASYTAQLASDAQDHAFKANLAVRF
jgi:outer membrane autotransporter protein